MTPLGQTIAFFFVSGALFGVGTGLWIGHKTGIQSGLVMDSSARETLTSEVQTLSAQNQQQLISLQTAEASIASMTAYRSCATTSKVRESSALCRAAGGREQCTRAAPFFIVR